MARRTRRPTVVWLPLDVTNRIQEGGAATAGSANAGFQIGLNVAGGSTQNVQIIPLVKDEPQGITGQTETLSDLEGSAYRLRRVVGKFFCQPQQLSTLRNANTTTSVMITAGLIVLRTDNTGAILAANTPQYDVQSLDSTRDPWIWRRSWVVSDQAQITAQNTNAPDTKSLIFPSSNVNGYGGGVMDGPHVDAKTARIVSDEERLFLVVSGVSLDGTDLQDIIVVICFGELRVLASMRKQSGNRRNASR